MEPFDGDDAVSRLPSMAPVTAPSAFSTVGLPEQQRVELWESHNATALIGLRCRSLTATVLEATEINLQLDRLTETVNESAILGHVVRRDPDRLALCIEHRAVVGLEDIRGRRRARASA